MTDREARKAFVKFCREQKESWLVCTVDREQLFWIWQAATLAERERWNIAVKSHFKQRDVEMDKIIRECTNPNE